MVEKKKVITKKEVKKVEKKSVPEKKVAKTEPKKEPEKKEEPSKEESTEEKPTEEKKEEAPAEKKPDSKAVAFMKKIFKNWPIIALRGPLILLIWLSFFASIYAAFYKIQGVNWGTPILFTAMILAYIIGTSMQKNKKE